MQGLGFKVYGSVFMVQGSGSRVWILGVWGVLSPECLGVEGGGELHVGVERRQLFQVAVSGVRLRYVMIYVCTNTYI